MSSQTGPGPLIAWNYFVCLVPDPLPRLFTVRPCSKAGATLTQHTATEDRVWAEVGTDATPAVLGISPQDLRRFDIQLHSEAAHGHLVRELVHIMSLVFRGAILTSPILSGPPAACESAIRWETELVHGTCEIIEAFAERNWRMVGEIEFVDGGSLDLGTGRYVTRRLAQTLRKVDWGASTSTISRTRW